MAIDLNELLLGEQASNLAAMARSHTNIMDLQQRVSLDKWASTDLLDAAAAKEVAKSGVATDLAASRRRRANPADAGWQLVMLLLFDPARVARPRRVFLTR